MSIFSDSIKLVDLPKYEDHRGFLFTLGKDVTESFKEDRYSVSNRTDGKSTILVEWGDYYGEK